MRSEEYDFLSYSGVSDHRIAGMNLCDNDGNPTGGTAADLEGGLSIRWQSGPVDRKSDVGLNGAFVEDVLEVCQRRLVYFQQSKFACKENAEAVNHIADAIKALLRRRNDRRDRGVEGTNTP